MLLTASFSDGKTPTTFRFFKIFFNKIDGVFDPITIKSGLNFFFNVIMVFSIIFLRHNLDFVPYGKFFWSAK